MGHTEARLHTGREGCFPQGSVSVKSLQAACYRDYLSQYAALRPTSIELL